MIGEDEAIFAAPSVFTATFSLGTPIKNQMKIGRTIVPSSSEYRPAKTKIISEELGGRYFLDVASEFRKK